MAIASVAPTAIPPIEYSAPEPAGDRGYEGQVEILDDKGQPLCRGFGEFSDGRLLVRRLQSSGAIATAYFTRRERRFRLVLADGSSRVACLRSCRWQDGDRMCEFTLFPMIDGEVVNTLPSHQAVDAV